MLQINTSVNYQLRVITIDAQTGGITVTYTAQVASLPATEATVVLNPEDTAAYWDGMGDPVLQRITDMENGIFAILQATGKILA